MAQLTARSEGSYALDGELDHVAVAALWPEARTLIEGHARLTIDLGRVAYADSAAVALLVYWLGQARRCQHQLRFANIPTQMHGLIQVAGLQALLADASSDND